MSLLPFLAIAFGAGTAALLTRHRADVSGGIAIAGLGLAAVAAVAAPLLERMGGPLSGAAPAGSAAAAAGPAGGAAAFLALGALSGLLLVLAAAGVGTVPRSVPGSTLVALGWAGLGLVSASFQAAALFAAAAGATSLLPVLDPRAVTERGAVAAAIVLRAVAVAALLVLGAVTLREAVAGDDAAAGLALLALAAAVALRFGVIPLHRPAARLAGLAPTVALPAVAAWTPAAFALAVAAGGGDARLPVERAVVVALALAGLGLAAVAVLLHDDLDHALGYAIAADGSVALLPLGAASLATALPALWGWLLVVAIGRTALAAWVLAAGGPAGTRRLPELGGWVRRSPLLAVALVAIAAASVGWPGSLGWDARAALVEAVVAWSPAATIVLAAAIGLPALLWLRLLAAGVRRPLPGIAGAGPEWRLRGRLATGAAAVLAALALATAAGLPGAVPDLLGR